MIVKTILSLLFLAFAECSVTQINILPDGKAKQLNIPDTGSGVEERRWLLKTKPDYRVRIFCRIAIKDCLQASLTVQNGKDELTFCGKRAAQVTVASLKNEMLLTLETRGRQVKPAICLASAVKSFVDSEEPDQDSSEAGSKPGSKTTTCACGWTNKPKKRIVGGVEAGVNEYPFIALIIRMDKRLPFCGGSIITPYHILTAAHCTMKLAGIPVVVRVGEHDYSTNTDTNATQTISVKDIKDHPDFQKEQKFNDISILVLAKKIEFNQLVGPVCLTKNRDDYQKQFVKVMGWGRLLDHGPISPTLMKINLKIIEFNQCVDYYKLDTEVQNQFCTYGKDKDTCGGDSGGPVVWLDKETNRYTQVGLVSYGKGCAEKDTPGVNTDVAYHFDWIQKTIKSTDQEHTCEKRL